VSYYTSFNVAHKVTCKKPIEAITHATKVVGFDLGLKDLVTISDGTKISPPKFLKASEGKLKLHQRRLSKKVKGSNNYQKQRVKVARCHEKIASQRRDFTHKLSSKIVSENQVICFEDLSVKNMVKSSRLSKSIHDASWSELVRQIKYKADWQNKVTSQVDRFYPSSKLCSTVGCDFKFKDLKLSTRTWICPCCCVTHDRDFNAAHNIKIEGTERAGLPVEEATAVVVLAQQVAPLKQEKVLDCAANVAL